MKKISWLLVLLLATSLLRAQKVYFIYLQTDNQQPFYARLGEKIYNSTASGYLILSNLRDSTYTVNIGIQSTQAPDQPYSISLNKKDQGYLIKNFGEKGWGLFNLTSLVVSMPISNSVKPVQTVKTEKIENNPFTELLAKAADDSTIKMRPVIVKTEEKLPDRPAVNIEKKEEITKDITPPLKEEIKKEVLPVEKREELKIDSSSGKSQEVISKNDLEPKADSAMAHKDTKIDLLRADGDTKKDSTEKVRSDSSIMSEVYKKSEVKLKSESSTTAGIGLVFLDRFSDDKTDTIRILIPAEVWKSNPVESKQEEKKFLDIPAGDSLQKENSAKVVATGINRCSQAATDDDFFKLRKKMAAESNDDDMIADAKKVFKTTCFSSFQLKNLSTLFLTDEFKYKFFDAAYPYTSDAENFSSLQSELKDDYFINRFKAMLRQ